MVAHGDYVENNIIPIRFVRTDDSLIRVLLLDGLYDVVKPLYDYFEVYGSAVSIDTPVTGPISACLDRIFDFTVEFRAMGWAFSIALVRLVAHWARQRVSLGKFTYEERGFGYNFGNNFGTTSTMFLELPVEE